MTRRTFLLTSARLMLAGLLGYLGARLGVRAVRQGRETCVSDGICTRCGVLTNCGLPTALSVKARKGPG